MINDREMKFVRLALDPAAHKGEIDNAATMFFHSLRARGILPDQFRIGATSQTNSKRRYIFPDWGKYANKPFDQIERSYLYWINRVWYAKLDDEGKASWKWLFEEINGYLTS